MVPSSSTPSPLTSPPEFPRLAGMDVNFLRLLLLALLLPTEAILPQAPYMELAARLAQNGSC